ncbi:twin-arginine translocase subunit TatC [Paenibacillus radicis (ex Xue et al. 2023)]|uniref:Sec-independent protein translocase protein TatC n=1 Tax=Paenibacillus radicis (ex Xue et al. 2023) TaxID=2972489 RepID=A0ABT1YRJ7_9BACL|nr:twin-arginine translocase subunit TatC [Paenibacillus radicis (ex Xue et al. 2023)]MCR8635807.1 twin-arginine translocase subunit TatC [Paenibacillus radicis (ex Xue et al. 2023)]
MEQEDWIFHLTEVRKRLLLVFGWFVATLCIGLYVSPSILRFIKSQPGAAGIEWNVFSFTDGLLIYMKCALLFALLFTLPILLYQLWAFVRPGLTDKEAKGALSYVPASFMLFLIGLAFSYLVVFPMMLRFMKNMNSTIGAVETYGIDKYFSFLFDVVLPMSAAFELPVVMLFLTRIGLLTPERLKTGRKYAYVGLAILGSCISPPDMLSHLSVTIPLFMLFEISVFVSGRQWRMTQESPANG